MSYGLGPDHRFGVGCSEHEGQRSRLRPAHLHYTGVPGISSRRRRAVLAAGDVERLRRHCGRWQWAVRRLGGRRDRRLPDRRQCGPDAHADRVSHADAHTDRDPHPHSDADADRDAGSAAPGYPHYRDGDHPGDAESRRPDVAGAVAGGPGVHAYIFSVSGLVTGVRAHWRAYQPEGIELPRLRPSGPNGRCPLMPGALVRTNLYGPRSTSTCRCSGGKARFAPTWR